MNLYGSTAAVLRYGVIISIIIIAVSLMMSVAELEYHEEVMWFGILALILTPLAGVIASLLSLIIEKDWKWVATALVLLVVISVGMIIAIFL